MPGLPDLDLRPSFQRHQAPLRLDYAASVNGVPRAAPAGAPFLYIELGCDSGLTLALLAAAHPRGRFVGVDGDALRLEIGKALAAAAGLGNVDFIEADPMEWAHGARPEADYLALSGLCNRLGAAPDMPVGGLVAGLLRPGGLAYLGYDALPGWAAALPLRQFLQEELAAAPASLDGLRAGLDRLAALRAVGAGYFARNPSAGRLLDRLRASDIGELARALSAPASAPLHFAAVAETLGAAGLRFVGSAELAHNYARSSVRGAFLPLLLGEADRGRAELHRDLVNDTWFRHDIFTKPPPGTPPSPTELVAEFVAGSAVPASEIRREIPLPDGAIALEGSLFDGLRRVLADRAVPIRELGRLPQLREMPQDAILSAIQLLMLGDQICPFTIATTPLETGPLETGAWRIPLAINRHMLTTAGDETMPLWLVSPALGGAIAAPPAAVPTLRAVAAVSGEGTALAGGAALTSSEKPAALRTLLAKYAELGIIAPR